MVLHRESEKKILVTCQVFDFPQNLQNLFDLCHLSPLFAVLMQAYRLQVKELSDTQLEQYEEFPWETVSKKRVDLW